MLRIKVPCFCSILPLLFETLIGLHYKRFNIASEKNNTALVISLWLTEVKDGFAHVTNSLTFETHDNDRCV